MREPRKVEVIGEPENFSNMVGRISSSVEKLLRNGINRKAVIILLCHETKLSQKNVEKVLNELAQLNKNFSTGKEIK